MQASAKSQPQDNDRATGSGLADVQLRGLPITLAAQSLTGRRSANQDRCVRLGLDQGNGRSAKPTSALLAVADGMGGFAGGELASSTAERMAGDLARRIRGDMDAAEVRSLLQEMYEDVTKSILEQAETDPELRDMGSTLSCAVVVDAGLVVANVGDSRVYHLAGNGLRQITTDHSALEEALQRNAVDPNSPEAHQLARVLTRSLSARSNTKPEFFPSDAETESTYDLNPGDVLLLTSDGCHGSVAEAEIVTTLRNAPSLQYAVDYLAHLALVKGSTDNVTVVGAAIGSWRRGKGKLPPLPNMAANELPRKLIRPLIAAAAVLCSLTSTLYLWNIHSAHQRVKTITGGGLPTPIQSVTGTAMPYLFTAQDLNGTDPYKACMGIDADWHSKRLVSRQLFALLDKTKQALLTGFLKEQNPTTDQKNDIETTVLGALNSLVQDENKEQGVRKVLKQHIPKVGRALRVKWERHLPDGRYYIHKWIISDIYPFQLIPYQLPPLPVQGSSASNDEGPSALPAQPKPATVSANGSSLPWMPRPKPKPTPKPKRVVSPRPIHIAPSILPGPRGLTSLHHHRSRDVKSGRDRKLNKHGGGTTHSTNTYIHSSPR